MMLDWGDALLGVAGGLMIGLAAALMLLGVGRVAGVSGLLDAALRQRDGEAGAFVAGLVAAPALVALLGAAPSISVTQAPATLLLGGALVGFGVATGGGCTSGHGVCGMSRLSPRSLAATATFMAVAAAAVAALGG